MSVSRTDLLCAASTSCKSECPESEEIVSPGRSTHTRHQPRRDRARLCARLLQVVGETTSTVPRPSPDPKLEKPRPGACGRWQGDRTAQISSPITICVAPPQLHGRA